MKYLLINNVRVPKDKIPGTIDSASNEFIKKCLGPPLKEFVFQNGIVVHALSNIINRIVGYYDEVGIHPAKES